MTWPNDMLMAMVFPCFSLLKVIYQISVPYYRTSRWVLSDPGPIWLWRLGHFESISFVQFLHIFPPRFAEPQEKKTVALHESGHAVAGGLLGLAVISGNVGIKGGSHKSYVGKNVTDDFHRTHHVVFGTLNSCQGWFLEHADPLLMPSSSYATGELQFSSRTSRNALCLQEISSNMVSLRVVHDEFLLVLVPTTSRTSTIVLLSPLLLLLLLRPLLLPSMRVDKTIMALWTKTLYRLCKLFVFVFNMAERWYQVSP